MLRSSTKKLCSPNSQNINPSQYHTRPTDLEQLLIHAYDHHIAHIYHPVTGAKETYDYLRDQDTFKWETSFSNEIGRLAQGVGTHMKNGNENIFFIPKIKVQSGRKIPFANPVCDYHPRKDDPYYIRLPISGDNLPYPIRLRFSCCNPIGGKNIFNSVISTPGSQFICAYIKDYFICSPMERFE